MSDVAEHTDAPAEEPVLYETRDKVAGNRMAGTRAYELGMVNRLVTRETLMDECLKMANTLAEPPRFALALTKQACNFVDDIKGKRTAMDGVFRMHQLAHARNRAV